MIQSIEGQVKPYQKSENIKMWGNDGHFEVQIRETTCKRKTHSLKSCDKDQFEALIREQIKVVGGSKTLFNKIHQGMMKQGKSKEFDPFFIKEQCDLYQWRKDFIQESENLCTCCLTFKEQYITEIFEYAMATECLNIDDDELSDFVWEQHGVPSCDKSGCGWCAVVLVDTTSDIQLLYDRNYMVGELEQALEDEFACEYDVLKAEQEDFIRDNENFQNYDVDDLGFNKLAHQIVELNLTSPKTLLEQSIKAVKKYNIPTTSEDMPSTLEKKMKVGLYTPGDEPPNFISSKGKDMFKSLNKRYQDIYTDADLVFLCSSLRAFGSLCENLYEDETELEEEFKGFVNAYENLYCDGGVTVDC